MQLLTEYIVTLLPQSPHILQQNSATLIKCSIKKLFSRTFFCYYKRLYNVSIMLQGLFWRFIYFYFYFLFSNKTKLKLILSNLLVQNLGSSLESPQSLTLSQYWFSWIHFPFVHVYSDMAHFVTGHNWPDFVPTAVVDDDDEAIALWSNTISMKTKLRSSVAVMALGHFTITSAESIKENSGYENIYAMSTENGLCIHNSILYFYFFPFCLYNSVCLEGESFPAIYYKMVHIRW